MFKLFRYLKPYWKAVVLAPLLMMVEVLTDLLQPRFLAIIVNQGIQKGDINFILIKGFEMIIIALIGIIGGFGCTIAASRASMSFGADLRYELFNKIQKFSFGNLDKFKTSSLITRMTNDVTQVQNMVQMMLRMFVRAPLLCIGGIIMAATLNPKLSSILLVSIPVLAILLAIIITKGFPLFNIAQIKLDRVNSVMQENLSGIRVVKAYVRGEKEKERFKIESSSLCKISKKAARIVALQMPVMQLIMNISIIAVLWFGGHQYSNNDINLGDIVAFITYMNQILFAIMMVAFILMSISRAKVSADRINQVFQTDIDIDDNENSIDYNIETACVKFENVSFKYKGAGGDPVLSNISFEAKMGETVAILGSTGSGKSTLVNLIPRLYDATEGAVYINDTDVKDYKLSKLRDSIGVVLQDTILFSGTIKENLKWGKEDATDDEIIEASKASCAHDFIMTFPQGYDTHVEQRGVNFSGGQKQRLAIARALIKKPKILILDDSTSAVDLGTEASIQRALKEVLKHTTCFIIAQRISSVMDADKIIVLEDGSIEAIGNHKELLQNSRVYQDIYNSQIREEDNIYA